MADNDRPHDRVKITFELDRDVCNTLKAIARNEHRTLAAQLRVVCEDAIEGVDADDVAA